jgi:acetylornithine deacetylase/succinyl-diaminopimelate desuccinylase-like protein
VTNSSATRPSAAFDASTWERAHEQLIADIQALIRLPTVNPPGDEIVAARYLEDVLEEEGLPSTVVEPFPGRGSIVARLHGDRTGGRPLLLLSHLDVVPASPGGWTHDPFSGDLADGYVWGRGALDMKDMVALEVGVLRLLAAETRAAGRDPASDPVPGFRRDVVFAATADEEVGGLAGAAWLVQEHPDWLDADGCLNEAGGVSIELAGRRFYPVQVAEKGYAQYRLAIHGGWGHGSMPRDDNAVLLAAEAVRRLAIPGVARPTELMRSFVESIAEALPLSAAASVRSILDDAGGSDSSLTTACDPVSVRAMRALLRDTISPTIIASGVKTNVIPGEAELYVDCRTLPGTNDEAMRAELRRRLGEDLWARIDCDTLLLGAAVESPPETELYRLLESTLRAHDPDAIPLPVMAPFGTDAKHTTRLGIPTYGFSPLRLRREDRFLELFHGVDERVSEDALRFGLPVLYDVVRRFCGNEARVGD